MPDSGIVTLLFTDLVGSTRTLQRVGDDAAEQLRRTHFRLLRDAVSTHGGQEVKNVGDGLMVVFGSAVDAVGCAVSMQQAVHRHNARTDGEPLEVRIGLHVGEPIRDEDDYFGTPVVIAKRLCDAAAGGRILASDLVVALCGSRGGHTFTDAGALELQGLAQPVRASEVAWQPASDISVGLPAALARASGPFAGRARETEALRSAWKRAASGERLLALVAGEPGIGKTRLVAEHARAVHHDGAIVLYGRCDEEGLLPYQPFVEAVHHLVSSMPPDRLRELAGAGAADLAALIPALEQRLPGLRAREPGDPETERYRMFEALCGCLDGASGDAPVLLVLDDLHWADKPTLALLRHLLRGPRAASMLVCGTYRDTDLSRTHPLAGVLADLRRDGGLERIALKGLDGQEIASMLAAAAGHDLGRRGRKLASALLDATEGNPFFVEQTIGHLIETGRIYRRDDVWTFDADVQDLGIPEGVREVIGRRLTRLSDDANALLAQAAVIGREFALPILLEVSGLGEDAVIEVLDEAAAVQLLVEEPGREVAYSFSHALVRQTLYEELSARRRQRLHARVAEAIERVRADDLRPWLAALAVHYREAGAGADVSKAIDYSIRAGITAASVFAYEETAAHWNPALELMEEEDTDPAGRARLLERLGDLMYVSGLDYAKSTEYLERALAIHERLGDRRRAGLTHSRLGRNLSSFPSELDIERAVEHYRTAGRLIGEEDDVPRAYVEIGLASTALWGVRPRQGLEASARALELAERLGDDVLWSLAATQHAWHLVATARIDEGFALLDRAMATADRLNHGFATFQATYITMGCWSLLADAPALVDLTTRELRTPRIAQAPSQRHVILESAVTAHIAVGAVPEARRLRERIVELEADLPLGAAVISTTPAGIDELLAYADGDWERTMADVRARWDGHASHGNRFGARYCRNFDGMVAALLGDLETAEERWAGLVGLAEEDAFPVVELWNASYLATSLAIRGRGERVPGLAERCRRIAGDQDLRGLAVLVAMAEAASARVSGDRDAMDAAYARASGLYDRFPDATNPWPPRLVWADALHAAGDHARAAELTEHAIADYRRWGYGERWIERAANGLAPRD